MNHISSQAVAESDGRVHFVSACEVEEGSTSAFASLAGLAIKNTFIDGDDANDATPHFRFKTCPPSAQNPVWYGEPDVSLVPDSDSRRPSLTSFMDGAGNHEAMTPCRGPRYDTLDMREMYFKGAGERFGSFPSPGQQNCRNDMNGPEAPSHGVPTLSLVAAVDAPSSPVPPGVWGKGGLAAPAQTGSVYHHGLPANKGDMSQQMPGLQDQWRRLNEAQQLQQLQLQQHLQQQQQQQQQQHQQQQQQQQQQHQQQQQQFAQQQHYQQQQHIAPMPIAPASPQMSPTLPDYLGSESLAWQQTPQQHAPLPTNGCCGAALPAGLYQHDYQVPMTNGASVAGHPGFALQRTQAPVHAGTRDGGEVLGEAGPRAPRALRGGARRLRLWAHIYLHMEADDFDLVPRLIGRGGCNMREIAEATGAKIRIRGRGSGHMELEGGLEAPVPLMVAVTTDKGDPMAFRSAMQRTLAILRKVERRFHDFTAKRGMHHDGACFSVGNISENALTAVSDILQGVVVVVAGRRNTDRRRRNGAGDFVTLAIQCFPLCWGECEALVSR
jgi:hypothetical protein